MTIKQFSSHPPKGVAFDLEDLIMLRVWANHHDIKMTIELDNCVDGEEYEELIAFQTHGCVLQYWKIWQTCQDVIFQPLIGRPRRFLSVKELIEALTVVVC